MNSIILLCITHVVWADPFEIYHTNSMAVVHGPSGMRNDSYFGFSSTYDKLNKRMIISAPRENNVGEVYSCDVLTNSCTAINNTINQQKRPSQYNHDFWFGATVRSTSKSIIACAPRLTEIISGFVGMRGRCFKRTNNVFSTEVKTGQGTISPQGVEKDMETLGWDMDVGPDDYLIVGGPAMYRTKGLAAISMSGSSKLIRMSVTNDTDVSFNFGYSVAVGYFLEKDKLSFAVGSTYGSKGPGQVYFFSYNKNINPSFPPKTLVKEVDTELVGSMFGAVLCAATLVRDDKKRRLKSKTSDVLVGAPTYVEGHGYNFGAVYVYIYSGNQRLPKYRRTIKGQKIGSFFGSAILNVGDLNGDYVHEVAIGAPYEDDGRGAVYVYSGNSLSSEKEQTLTWLQRLQPSGRYRSFGLSLAAINEEEGKCQGLAVGAPFDDQVMVYKCLAVVTITGLAAKFPTLQNRTSSKQTDFTVPVCVTVKYPSKPKDIVGMISTTIEINHPSAIILNKSPKLFNFQSSLHDHIEEYCEDFKLHLPTDGDYGVEIGYEISTKLLNSPVSETTFNENKVILSDASQPNLYRYGSVWAAECAGALCISNLSLSINSTISVDPFIIGSSDKEAFVISVRNTGEVAYDPCVRVTVKGAKVYKPPNSCTRILGLEPTWECPSTKPLRTDLDWVIDEFIVDLQDLTNKDTSISYDAELYYSCKTADTKTELTTKSVTLKSSTEHVTIKGSNDYGDIVSLKQDVLVNDGKRLEHVYEIKNRGWTNFVDLECIIALEKNKFVKYLDMPINTGGRDTCKVINNTDSEITVQCIIGSLTNSSNVKLLAYMDIVPSYELYETVLEKNLTILSNIVLNLPNDDKRVDQLSTIITLQTAFVDLWILILAGIVGLCLIVILALILYECGFLRRKNKEELEKLKTSVKRQTIRRSMMQSQPAEDRVNILEKMEEADEALEEEAAGKSTSKETIK